MQIVNVPHRLFTLSKSAQAARAVDEIYNMYDNVPSRLSSQWLHGDPWTWAQVVRLYMHCLKGLHWEVTRVIKLQTVQIWIIILEFDLTIYKFDLTTDEFENGNCIDLYSVYWKLYGFWFSIIIVCIFSYWQTLFRSTRFSSLLL